MASAPQQVTVLAEPRDRTEAIRLVKGLGVHPHLVPIDRPFDVTPSNQVLIYFSDRDQISNVRSFLQHASTSVFEPLILVFFVHTLSRELVSEVAYAAGQILHKHLEFAFGRHDVERWLLSPTAAIETGITSSNESGLLQLRKKLDVTQDQLATALNISRRTVQNWEQNNSTSQMKRKTRDLWELAELIDHYVVSGKESEWLRTKLKAFQGRRPLDLLLEGKIRDLIIEFRRLQQGEPV